MSNRIETNRTNDGFSVVAAGVDIEKTIGTAAYREVTTVIAEGKASLPTAGAVAQYVLEYGGGAGAELLWKGEFNGSGYIDAPGLSDYLVIGIESKSGMIYIGNIVNGGSLIGQLNGTNLNFLAYRFQTSSEYPDRLTVNSSCRGLTFNSGTTATTPGNSDVTIAKIYGLIKKPATN